MFGILSMFVWGNWLHSLVDTYKITFNAISFFKEKCIYIYLQNYSHLSNHYTDIYKHKTELLICEHKIELLICAKIELLICENKTELLICEHKIELFLYVNTK